MNELDQRARLLAEKVLLRKAIKDTPIMENEARLMLGDSGLDPDLVNELDPLFYADYAYLAKGGIIGSISHAVKNVGKAVSHVAAQVAAPLSKIPIVGKGLAAIVTAPLGVGGQFLQGNVAKAGKTFLADGVQALKVGAIGAGAMIGGPAILGALGSAGGMLASGLGTAVADVGSLVGGVGGGAMGAIGDVISEGESLVSGVGGGLSGGFESALSTLDPSLASGLKSAFSSLSGQGPGNWLTNIGGEVVKITKDAQGLFSAQKIPPSGVSQGVQTQLAGGGLYPAPASIFAAPSDVAGVGGSSWAMTAQPIAPIGSAQGMTPETGTALSNGSPSGSPLGAPIPMPKQAGMSPVMVFALLGMAATAGLEFFKRGKGGSLLSPHHRRRR